MRLLLQILSVLWALLLVLVGMRFLMLLIGANADSELVQWVMTRSQFWVAPFFGIFHLTDQSITRQGVFEFASLIAFIVYAVIGSIIAWAISMPFGGGGRWYGRHHPLGI